MLNVLSMSLNTVYPVYYCNITLSCQTKNRAQLVYLACPPPELVGFLLNTVQWVIRSIPYGGPFELFRVPASAPRMCNKGCGMCYPVCGIVIIKYPLLLFRKNNSCCDGSRFFLLPSECPLPYV